MHGPDGNEALWWSVMGIGGGALDEGRIGDAVEYDGRLVPRDDDAHDGCWD